MRAHLLLLALLGCQPLRAAPAESILRPVSEVQWTALNPARGDASPRAATLWGDRTQSGPSGFLVKFADGFSSPPHTHNVTYRAVVLEGEIHNDDAGAAPMWMVPGSFWTQPVSESHITASRGASMAYVEIDDGPYLVHPAEQARPVTEKPVNLDASNIVWTDSGVEGVQVSRLWGEPDTGVGGVMVRLQPAAATRLRAAETLRADIIEGSPDVNNPRVTAERGSLLSGTSLAVAAPADAGPAVLYLRTASGFTAAVP